MGRAGNRKHVAVESGQRALAERGDDPVAEDSVAADAGVDDADGPARVPGGQTLCQPVGPAAVGPHRGLVAVGNGIAERHDDWRAGGGGLDLHAGEEGAVLRHPRGWRQGKSGRVARKNLG